MGGLIQKSRTYPAENWPSIDQSVGSYNGEAPLHSSSLPAARTNKSHSRSVGAPATCRPHKLDSTLVVHVELNRPTRSCLRSDRRRALGILLREIDEFRVVPVHRTSAGPLEQNAIPNFICGTVCATG